MTCKKIGFVLLVLPLLLGPAGCNVKVSGPTFTTNGAPGGPGGGGGGGGPGGGGGTPGPFVPPFSAELNSPEAQAIKNMGGQVFAHSHSFLNPGLRVAVGGNNFGDAEFTQLMPKLKALGKVRLLTLSGSKVTDQSLVPLKELTTLEGLELGSTDITDAGMDILKTMPQLRYLTFPQKVTDAGVAKLSGLTEIRALDLSLGLSEESLKIAGGFPKLEKLYMFGSKFTDKGLEYIKGLTELRELDTFGTHIKGFGLQHLTSCTKLKRLGLTSGPTSGKSLVYLKNFPDLEVLNLFSADYIADDDLKHIQPLTKLWSLDLRSTGVTDKGLEHLKGMTNLQYISLNMSKVTPAGVSELQKALPKARITT